MINTRLKFLAIVIATSFLHIVVYKEYFSILLIDTLILLLVVVFFRDAITFYKDKISITFYFLLFIMSFHNILMIGSIPFFIKEGLQSVELIFFYNIIRKFTSTKQSANKIIHYIFILSSVLFGIILIYVFIEGLHGGQLKKVSLPNVIAPLLALSFFYNKNYIFSKKFREIVFLVSIIAVYFGLLSLSRTFAMVLFLIMLSSLMYKSKIIAFSVKIAFIALFVLLLTTYSAKYENNISVIVNHITSDTAFGHDQYIELNTLKTTISNRQRINQLKYIYMVLNNNILLGKGNGEASSNANLHGILPTILVDYGVFIFILFIVLLWFVYQLSKKNILLYGSPDDYAMHYYFIYSLVFLLFVGNGIFSILPFIISMAFIASKRNNPASFGGH
jgi:hypothetical protein